MIFKLQNLCTITFNLFVRVLAVRAREREHNVDGAKWTTKRCARSTNIKNESIYRDDAEEDAHRRADAFARHLPLIGAEEMLWKCDVLRTDHRIAARLQVQRDVARRAMALCNDDDNEREYSTI